MLILARQTLKPLYIFVAEDNPADVQLLGEILNEQNVAHHLHVEINGEEAIKFVAGISQSEIPDLFVIDMQMPKLDGLHVAQSIRNRSQLSTVPILLVSSCLSRTDEIEAGIIPLCFFFKKPMFLNEWFEIGLFIQTLFDDAKASNLKARPRQWGLIQHKEGLEL